MSIPATGDVVRGAAGKEPREIGSSASLRFVTAGFGAVQGTASVVAAVIFYLKPYFFSKVPRSETGVNLFLPRYIAMYLTEETEDCMKR